VCAVLLPVAIIYIFVITFVFLKRTGHTYSSRDTLMIGLLWLVLTIAFEFAFGALVMGSSLLPCSQITTSSPGGRGRFFCSRYSLRHLLRVEF
jgi:hypothetical protein